ncbi:MAG: hypothetical protein AAF447_00030 [Myxococcota bacterium]
MRRARTYARGRGHALLALLALVACGDAAEPVEPAPSELRDELGPAALLTRASMALRGTRPTLDELDAIEADPGRYVELVENYLYDPRFLDTMRDLHGDVLGMNLDGFSAIFGFRPFGPLADVPQLELNRSLTDSPLELIADIIDRDLSYGEIVTADYVFADETVATVWGLPYDEARGGWQAVRPADGRDVAGILSDSAIFNRHDSTFFNRNRGRANMVSRALLCFDFLDRSVEIDTDVDLGDDAAVENAIAEQESCQNCHQSLDPLAAFFAPYGGGAPAIATFSYPTPFPLFDPENAAPRRTADPAYFGRPASTIAELGQEIAADPRFALCASRHFASYLLRVPQSDVPRPLVEQLYTVFTEADLNARALARAVVLAPAFRLAGSDAEEDAWSEGLHLARPRQLARAVEDLTGYRMLLDVDALLQDPGTTFGVIDLMDDSVLGYEVLAGGTDGFTVTTPARSATATSSLVRETLARRAAFHVVRADFEAPGERRRLFPDADLRTTDEAMVRAVLAQLQRRLYGVRLAPDDPALDAAQALFAGLRAESGDPERAWGLTLAALLEDPRFATY